MKTGPSGTWKLGKTSQSLKEMVCSGVPPPQLVRVKHFTNSKATSSLFNLDTNSYLLKRFYANNGQAHHSVVAKTINNYCAQRPVPKTCAHQLYPSNHVKPETQTCTSTSDRKCCQVIVTATIPKIPDYHFKISVVWIKQKQNLCL